MHPDYERADRLSGDVIGAAIEVHRLKGPGLIESIYERCVVRELALRGISSERQVRVPIEYKGEVFEEMLRLDLFVEKCLIVEAKVVESVIPVHKAQLLSYMRLMNAPIGLLINFNELLLKNGIHRVILKGASS